MNILITGATGFIGSHLTKELYKQGYHCRCLVRNIEKAKEIFRDYEDIEFVVGDLTKKETLKNVANNIDIVFHLAAHGHVAAASEEAFKNFYEINVKGTDNLLNECLNKNISKFFHFSSTAAVGLIPDIVVDENTTPNPQTPYQKSKLESENAAMNFFYEDRFPVIIFRPCMVYGIRGYGEFYKFVKLVKKGFMPKIGWKKKLTPIVHVTDVVQACVKGIKRAKPGEVYFICGDRSYPFDDIIDLIKKSIGSKKITPVVPYSLAILVSYCFACYAKFYNKTPFVTPKNIRSTVCNRLFSIEKAKCQLGYTPEITFERGVAETVNWFRSLEC